MKYKIGDKVKYFSGRRSARPNSTFFRPGGFPRNAIIFNITNSVYILKFEDGTKRRVDIVYEDDVFERVPSSLTLWDI